jgi:hypothetical protein
VRVTLNLIWSTEIIETEYSMGAPQVDVEKLRLSTRGPVVVVAVAAWIPISTAVFGNCNSDHDRDLRH